MRRLRWRAAAAGAALGLAATIVPATVAPPPASATHAGSFLQVTPEVSDVQVGSTVTLTAGLYDTTLGLLGRRPVALVLSPVVVRFTFEGGPLQGTADAQCTVSAPHTCSIPVTSQAAGTTLVRVWTDGHTPDDEGRLASDAAASSLAADCITPEEGEGPGCLSGDPVIPGLVAEPDSTDVVRITWRDHGLDVVPDNQERLPGETATLTARAFDLAGNPSAGVEVKFELFEGSVSDPGGGNTPNIPEKECTTGADGACAVTIAQEGEGTDLVCAWTSTSPPAMTGTATQTGTCGGETLFDTSANDGTPSPVDDDVDVVRVIWRIPPPPTTPPPGGVAPPVGTGYWLVAADGGVFAFGDAAFHGSAGAQRLNQPIVGMAHTPSRRGYFMVAADGGIFAFGDAVFRGSAGAIRLSRPIVGMATTPAGLGYWLVAADGGVFAFGDAAFHGSTGALRLNQPVVGMAPTPSGRGYLLVAADGGIFAFGDAAFRGSTGAMRLTRPIVGMDATPTGGGYWLVGSDGGIFAFGDAAFRGSTGAMRLNQPVVGMAGF
ncbi:MAG TPA: hypothetical protein VM263_01655 [Acidimicrobiales bacterium]|nr:hypothetical protein [Acidimicrobiales bacterium]